MPITAVKVYQCDDGKSYTRFEDAQRAQTAWRAAEIKRKAHRVHMDRLQGILNKVSANTATNSLITIDLVNKNDVAVALRDALNKVIDYQRRTKKV